MIPLVAGRKQGKFITFEGLDGSGKSTHVARLADTLRAAGLDVLATREPGGTPVGERVRAILVDSATSDLSPWAELALMFSARAQHIQTVILPALHRGTTVLCDRFTDSSEAYQGGGRKLGSEPVLELHRILCDGLQPDLTFLLNTTAAFSVARARRRNRSRRRSGDEGRFESENAAFFDRVHRKFLEIARRDVDRVLTIEARRSIEVVHREILAAVHTRLFPGMRGMVTVQENSGGHSRDKSPAGGGKRAGAAHPGTA
ncbi:MAG TPA: dTMP kinase [Terriglobales bacterium]|nr:dTMP kinase [Terriglobales bacterium]